MGLYDVLVGGQQQATESGRMAGVMAAIVTDIEDPDKLGRVKVKFPWRSEEDESHWARVAMLMGGKDRGTLFLPEVNDEVLVAFEQGDVQRPYVIGALWNGVDTPPKEFANDGKNNVRLIKSRSGHLIKLDDTDGNEKIEILDKTGKNSIVIDSKANTVTISSDQDIALEAPKGKIGLHGKEVEIRTSAAVKVEAGSEMTLKATGTMTVQGATVNIN